ncbi:3-deoxy-manno-octulosonate cytidylyltransferase [Chitinophaga vietnamensis]|uniref:3-deoxy-manno-octulosonate cytidylyltransferase n=1 Tax=Chitinophaga vietnamensis TaxID=2593957 RepID=UPI0011782DB6|nr:3-deoxy-manno-octulosonate cytidylyltransferase [Chitinophaga vietnamensis]
MKILAIIPARYKSSRFPGKPLQLIQGIPLMIRVAQRTSGAVGKENVVIATESEEIRKVGESYGFKVVLTSDSCLTGTDRVWEVAQQIAADIYVNVQGDEPLIDPGDIQNAIAEKQRYPEFVINGMQTLLADDDPANINIPKVLTKPDQQLLYMSRLPIPGIKGNPAHPPVYKKQVCVYAFSYQELSIFGKQPAKTPAEAFEDIEILRFLELGVPVRMLEMKSPAIAVDTPEDVIKVEAFLSKNAY